MSSLPTESRQWTLANHPPGVPTYGSSDSTFTIETKPLPSLSSGQLLLKTLYLSNDPAQRGWISSPEDIDPKRLYVPPVQLGEAMRARGIGKVLKSEHEEYKEGDLVQAGTNWREYAVVDASDPKAGVRKLGPLPGGLSPTHYLGALGMTGLTAYYGLVEVVGAKQGESVVVSGAAGATGSMVVQIAKHIVGAKYVVGIAGTDEKCRWVESLGADKCLNYKSKDFKKQLSEACGDGVNVYFDNVGGEILDLMLGNMAMYGRVAACGAITGYNGEAKLPMSNWFDVITMRIQIKGFIVIDYLQHAAEVIQKLAGAVKEGKIKIGDENETVVEGGFEDIPKTWLKLFDGANTGKLVTALK